MVVADPYETRISTSEPIVKQKNDNSVYFDFLWNFFFCNFDWSIWPSIALPVYVNRCVYFTVEWHFFPFLVELWVKPFLVDDSTKSSRLCHLFAFFETVCIWKSGVCIFPLWHYEVLKVFGLKFSEYQFILRPRIESRNAKRTISFKKLVISPLHLPNLFCIGIYQWCLNSELSQTI